jgi:dihydroneopterin aldolase
MSDFVFIEQARFPCRIGVTPKERLEPQDILIDVELGMNLSGAGASDNIHDTLNYSDAWETMRAYVTGHEFHLVEALARGIGLELMERHTLVEWASVRVNKPAALASRGAFGAGVKLTVTRDESGA